MGQMISGPTDQYTFPRKLISKKTTATQAKAKEEQPPPQIMEEGGAPTTGSVGLVLPHTRVAVDCFHARGASAYFLSHFHAGE